MSKKFSIIVLIIILAVSGWYLFIKDYNYKITFKTAQKPGAVYATLEQWGDLGFAISDSIAVTNREPFKSIGHHVFKNDSVFKYSWDFERLSNDTTKVVAYVKDQHNSLQQNIAVAFGKNPFTQANTAEVRKLMEYFRILDENYTISDIDEEPVVVPGKFVAYIPLHTKIVDKANAMRNNIVVVMGYIRKHELDLDGDPFLMVNELIETKGTIKYDFCFPIKKLDSLPPTFNVKFKNVPEYKALKTNFYGNYRFTESAWYELLSYAEENDIDILKQPVEIYKNDPQSGTDSKDWLAEIYLPIK